MCSVQLGSARVDFCKLLMICLVVNAVTPLSSIKMSLAIGTGCCILFIDLCATLISIHNLIASFFLGTITAGKT